MPVTVEVQLAQDDSYEGDRRLHFAPVNDDDSLVAVWVTEGSSAEPIEDSTVHVQCHEFDAAVKAYQKNTPSGVEG